MSLPSSGAISMSNMDAEIGVSNTATISLGSNNVRMMGGQANGSSGAISANSFYGKTYQDGSTSARAAPSALFIKQLTGTTTNGIYWVKPASGISATQVYCDMNTNGGGYMLIARSNPAGISSGSWGWQGTAIGSPTTYSAAYQLPIYTWYQAGYSFSEYIFGNQNDNISNNWGPFIYQVVLNSLSTFMTSDTQQSGYSYATLKSNTNIYGTTSFPGMQGAIGYPVSGTTNNFYYMRDCCGFAGYGAYATGMATTYCSSTSVQFYAGPWCSGATLSGNTYVQGGSSSAGNTGGTSQYMIMVR